MAKLPLGNAICAKYSINQLSEMNVKQTSIENKPLGFAGVRSLLFHLLSIILIQLQYILHWQFVLQFLFLKKSIV